MMRVFVYFNLHRKCWSVRALNGRYKGRVVAHCDRVLLTDVEFRVSEAGRQRVLREGRKNVHAGVVGSLCGMAGSECFPNLVAPWWMPQDARYLRYAKAHGTRVTYNPRHHETFKTLSPLDGQITGDIHDAPMAALDARTVNVFDPCNMPEDF